MKMFAIFAALCGGIWMSASATAAEAVKFEPYTLTGPDGAKAEGQLGTLMVPENRANREARQIPLRFVRLPSTAAKPGFPVVYLAGGPGGSAVGNGKGPRFGFFNKLRAVGDVILLEQRGAGLSNTLPSCASQPFDPARPLDRQNVTDGYRRELVRCIAFWRNSGADVAGYNTIESAADLEDLRRALGAERLNLVGLSYGTHLGMAALKRGLAVERAVFSGLEGLEQTVKLPAHFDAFFARVAEAVRASPAGAVYPDLVGMMRRVHAKLEREPVTVTVKDRNGQNHQIRFSAFPIQMLVGYGLISDPARQAKLPLFYFALDNGLYQPAGEMIFGAMYSEFNKMSGMPELMDLASGISPARLALVRQQAKSAVLGDAGNFPMPHAYDVAPALSLSEDFRRPLSTTVPTLLIMSTLDGRTPVESQSELLPQFRAATRLTVVNGGHNIFEQSDKVQEEIVRFLQSGAVAVNEVTLPQPTFEMPPQPK